MASERAGRNVVPLAFWFLSVGVLQFCATRAAPPWALLLASGLFLLTVGIGLRDPWPADEPRFALIAKEILQTGHFWFPRRGGDLYPDKPPVFIRLSALVIGITGSVRWGFLLPSLLADLGTLWLVTDLVRRLHGDRTAWLASAALLATVQFVLQAKSSQIDMVLTFFTTLGAYGILRHALLAMAKGVAWLSIQTTGREGREDTTLAQLQAWQKSKNASPTAAIVDWEGKIARNYRATATPHMYVVDPQGTLIYAGAIDSKASANPADTKSATNHVSQALGEAMSGKPVSRPITQAYGCAVKYPSEA